MHALLEFGALNALEIGEIADMFARSETRIKAGLIRENPETGLGGNGIGNGVMAIDLNAA